MERPIIVAFIFIWLPCRPWRYFTLTASSWILLPVDHWVGSGKISIGLDWSLEGCCPLHWPEVG